MPAVVTARGWTAAGAGAIAAIAAVAAGCGPGTKHVAVPNADPGRGKRLIEHYGCGACHRIAGIAGADGRVGTDLRHFASSELIAGRLPNDVANAIEWIRHPQELNTKTAMPDLGVGEQEARDIVAYLYAQ